MARYAFQSRLLPSSPLVSVKQPEIPIFHKGVWKSSVFVLEYPYH
jgi:hypothetical protein